MNNPNVSVRHAAATDCSSLAQLLNQLGFPVSVDALRQRFDAFVGLGERVFVATIDLEVVGVVTAHVTPVLHRPTPVGRITMLVVAENVRGHGIGRALVEAAESELAAFGCELMEVTSNGKLERAHGFYERLGYSRTSHRFGKSMLAT